MYFEENLQGSFFFKHHNAHTRVQIANYQAFLNHTHSICTHYMFYLYRFLEIDIAWPPSKPSMGIITASIRCLMPWKRIRVELLCSKCTHLQKIQKPQCIFKLFISQTKQHPIADTHSMFKFIDIHARGSVSQPMSMLSIVYFGPRST